MRVLPKGKNVLVKPEDKPKKVGLIYVPETVSESKHKTGIILDIGEMPGSEVSVGDKVMYSMTGVTKVDSPEGELHLVPYKSFLIWAL
jgi:co-chaperonin GroES (HSP10)